MDIASLAAERQYQMARTATAADPSAAAGSGFFGAFDSFAAVLQSHENTARDALSGRADPQALLQAVTASQMAVDTVVTMRDRVVEAYQEILRMPV